MDSLETNFNPENITKGKNTSPYSKIPIILLYELFVFIIIVLPIGFVYKGKLKFEYWLMISILAILPLFLSSLIGIKTLNGKNSSRITLYMILYAILFTIILLPFFLGTINDLLWEMNPYDQNIGMLLAFIPICALPLIINIINSIILSKFLNNDQPNNLEENGKPK